MNHYMTARQRASGSLNAEYAAVCGGKFRHPNFLSAMAHARSLEAEDGKEAAVYGCPFCGSEHVGHVSRHGLYNKRHPVIGIGPASFENFIEQERKGWV